MKFRNKTFILLLIILLISFVRVCGIFAEDIIVLPDNLTVIENEAFRGVQIRNITLPDSLNSIGSKAFADTGLTKVIIPQNVQYIAPDAFDGCSSLIPFVYSGSYADQWCAEHNFSAWYIISLDVSKHTQTEIRNFVNAYPADIDSDTTYRRQPTLDPYTTALISNSSTQNAINMLNQIRYIAGINADVVNDSSKEEMEAAAAFIQALLGYSSHTPPRPSAIADSQYDNLYALACDGASSSNLYPWKWNLADSILGYMYDSDSSNIDRVGHRRWILNPTMGKTAFGSYYHPDVNSHPFTAMYSFDRSGSGTQQRVAWPAQQTPLSHFIDSYDHAWSVSFSKSIDMNAVRVQVTRARDGKTWVFSQDHSDGDFYVNNAGYGATGCVIFRPDFSDDYDWYYGIDAGEKFDVIIENSSDRTVLKYSVTFFDL